MSGDRNYVSTGLPALDLLLGRGYARGHTILVTGPPHSGKTLLMQHFVHGVLKSGLPCLWLTSEASPDALRESFVMRGWDIAGYEMDEKFFVVDCFTSQSELAKSKEPFSVLHVENPIEMSITVQQCVDRIAQRYRKPIMAVIDSATTLSNIMGFNEMLRLLRTWRSRAALARSILAVVANSSAHSKSENANFEGLSGTVLSTSDEQANGSRELTVVTSIRRDISEGLDYRLTSEGIQLVLNDDKLNELRRKYILA